MCSAETKTYSSFTGLCNYNSQNSYLEYKKSVIARKFPNTKFTLIVSNCSLVFLALI